MKKSQGRYLVCVLLLGVLVGIYCFSIQIHAANDTIEGKGKVFEFDGDSEYSIFENADYKSTDDASTYGSFSINGTESVLVSTGEKNGVPAYSVHDGNAVISYTYTDALLNAADEEWHLEKDSKDKIDVFKLDSKINIGAIVLQRSVDHLNWSSIVVHTNVFNDIPIQTGTLYETLPIETINGCYYRLIVVYKTVRKTGTSKILGLFPKDEYEHKRTAEVYEFYVATENEHITELNSNDRRYALGETVLTSDYANYSGSKEMEKDDIHYGWELGNFFVSGFTGRIANDDNVVFLKDTGDVVTLWFNLKQNIDALNNDGSLSITSDADGSDKYFQTPTTNFGRGMLIIRYTDHENVKHDPVMYYNFLEANTSPNADTRVYLFEEGDYEVALDYEVTKDQLVDKSHHYRIFFKFSVRNGNTILYPFDLKTGAELTNSAVTENGFRLDLAKSRYLDIFIKKEVLVDSTDGLTEDTRFNTVAKDGDEYSEEGIYTVTAKNTYTGQETSKKIYVGSNSILKAYVTTGYSIPYIRNLTGQGAVINEDGTITLPTGVDTATIPTETDSANESCEPVTVPLESDVTDKPNSAEEPHEPQQIASYIIPIGILGCIVVAIVIIVLVNGKKRKEKVEKEEEKEKEREEEA